MLFYTHRYCPADGPSLEVVVARGRCSLLKRTTSNAHRFGKRRAFSLIIGLAHSASPKLGAERNTGQDTQPNDD
jgi:hypothetical protein